MIKKAVLLFFFCLIYPSIAGAAQYARPDADITDGDWVATGGPTDHYDCLEEVSANDSEYIRDPGADATCEIRLGDVTDPGTGTGHIFHVRMRSSGSGQGEKVQMRLKQGGSSLFISGSYQNRSGSFSDQTYNVIESQADLITDYTDLTISFENTGVTGADTLDVSQWYFEVPDASGGGGIRNIIITSKY